MARQKQYEKPFTISADRNKQWSTFGRSQREDIYDRLQDLYESYEWHLDALSTIRSKFKELVDESKKKK